MSKRNPDRVKTISKEKFPSLLALASSGGGAGASSPVFTSREKEDLFYSLNFWANYIETGTHSDMETFVAAGGDRNKLPILSRGQLERIVELRQLATKILQEVRAFD
jgi:lipocalin